MPKYPFSQRDLPYGCAVFLNKTGVNGAVLNNPNHGGFLQWALYPKFKIYMNMQVPHLFSDEDIYLLSKALSQSNVLKSLIQRYQPGFITVSLINKNFKNLIKSFPQYKLVFFDDVEALYADKNTYPKIVEKYQLNYLDPFMITSIDIDKLMAKKTYDSEELAELSRMLDVYPDCGLKNQIFAVILNKKGEYHKAIPYADRLIDNFPDAYAGYKLRAASLKGMEQYDKAILEYEKVLKRTKDQLEIYSEIGSIYMKQEKYSKAYKTLSEVIDPFAGSTDYKSFYNLCLAAIKSGNRKDAQILIRYANVLVPPEDKEWNEKYARLAEMIKEGGKVEGR
jgi:tetratricopeptide (TPR) repeat protein